MLAELIKLYDKVKFLEVKCQILMLFQFPE